MKKYKLTEEHKALLPMWRDKWIKNAMSVKAMDEHDKEQMRRAIKGLYESAGLKAPPPGRIIFVPSPFVARFAGGFAAAIWHKRKNAATYDATRDATDGATYAATRAATRAATYDATYAATRAATRAATYDATRDATDAATDAATDETENKNWFSSIRGFLSVSVRLGVGDFGLKCAVEASKMYQGGNQWSAYDSFLSFFKDVVKLDLLIYDRYKHWQVAAEHGSYRIMHPEFCIISDRPEILTVDDQNRPHGENGPFCKWRDGMALYSWHGVRIPEYWMTERHKLTPEIALKWPNIEQRRAACEILGWANILKQLSAKIIDRDSDQQIGTLLEVSLPDLGKEKFLRVTCGTGREFAMPVPPDMQTALQANAWTYNLEPKDYMPEIRT